MRREQTNQIRFVMEELLPPILRDTALFKYAASLAWGRHISDLAQFRKSAPFVTAEQYSQLYLDHPRVHEGTDITPLLQNAEKTSVMQTVAGNLQAEIDKELAQAEANKAQS